MRSAWVALPSAYPGSPRGAELPSVRSPSPFTGTTSSARGGTGLLISFSVSVPQHALNSFGHHYCVIRPVGQHFLLEYSSFFFFCFAFLSFSPHDPSRSKCVWRPVRFWGQIKNQLLLVGKGLHSQRVCESVNNLRNISFSVFSL